MEAAIKSVLPVYAAGLWMYTGKILMPFPTNKDHQSPALSGGGEGGGGSDTAVATRLCLNI